MSACPPALGGDIDFSPTKSLNIWYDLSVIPTNILYTLTVNGILNWWNSFICSSLLCFFAWRTKWTKWRTSSQCPPIDPIAKELQMIFPQLSRQPLLVKLAHLWHRVFLSSGDFKLQAVGTDQQLLLGPIFFLKILHYVGNAEPGWMDILGVFINNVTICEAHCRAIKMQMHLLYFKTMTRATRDKLIR